MASTLTKIQQFLDSNDIDGAREEVANTVLNLETVDTTVLDFASLLALGSQNILEISLGVLGRRLLNETEIKIDVIWLFLAAILSRTNITPNSLSRISILGLTSWVKNWESPIFALLTPALDAFLKVSLADTNPLIAEQTLDFLASCGESYAKAPHSRVQLHQLRSYAQSVLGKVDDLELNQEWTEGIDAFIEDADNIKYSDENIWSAGENLLKEIYSPKVLRHDAEVNSYSLVKDNISRLITSSLASIASIREVLGRNSLSIAVRIDNFGNKNLWSVGANVIDKLERFLQEIADAIFERMGKLPTFTPPQSIPGSWTIILQMDLSSDKAELIAREIASLSSIENETNSSISDSWRYCVAKFKEDELRVNLAVATNTSELQFVHSISTDDITDIEEPLQSNIRVFSYDVPQANKLERVLDFALLLVDYPFLPTLQQKFIEIDRLGYRSYSYYRRSTQILGLANERVQATTACRILRRMPSPEAKIRFLAYQFMSSNVCAAWFSWQNANDLSEIDTERAAEFLFAVCPSLSESTVGRRAQTLQSWVSTFKEHYI